MITTNFREFDCLFWEKDNPITDEPEYIASKVMIDLNSCIAFNPFRERKGYTVLRMKDGISYIVKEDYSTIRVLITETVALFQN